MKIGYPCINWSIGCKGDRTFRLKSYSEERLIETVDNNLNCLKKMLEFNIKNNILFFRITSDLIPFASHPICGFDWQDFFKRKFENIGKMILKYDIRISMHPDQFIVLNSNKKQVIERSVAELNYHAQILDLMRLNNDSKIQLHIGGAYGDKNKSIDRFIYEFNRLDDKIKNRLVVENDDHIYNLNDCLALSEKIDIPVLFDYFHHLIYNNKENINSCLESTKKTWNDYDGIPMVDYSSQNSGYKKGRHAEILDPKDFRNFVDLTKSYDFDIMLEIKDKEKSAIRAVDIIKNDKRFKKVIIKSDING
jgi:UV DNA damage endonuclease